MNILTKTLKTIMILTLSIFIQNCAPASSFDKAATGNSATSTSNGGVDDDSLAQRYGLSEEEYLQQATSPILVSSNNIASKIKCTFYFVGEEGAQWISERYTDADKRCSTELSTVKANNPRATLSKIVENFVHDNVPTIDKTKCTYFMKGQNGAEWFTERYIPWGSNCKGAEFGIVRDNNPLAQILSVQSNFVHDPIKIDSKTKCSFHLIGEKDAHWISERYIHADENCSKEVLAVRANNPKANIATFRSNFVFDPF